MNKAGGRNPVCSSLFCWCNMAMKLVKMEEAVARPTLADFFTAYETSLKAANRSPKTIQWYLWILETYFRYLISENLMKPLTKLGRSELTLYIRNLQNAPKWQNRFKDNSKGNLSPASIQGHVRAVKAFWGWLHKEGFIETNPLEKFPLPKAPVREIRILSASQLKLLLAAIDRNTANGAKYYCILLLLLDAGPRISELVNLKLSDLDLVSGFFTVMGKGGKERSVPFSGQLRRVLQRYLNHHRASICKIESDYLFPTADGGHVSVNAVQQYLRRLKNRVGLASIKCSPHIFRHTLATMLIAAGATPFAVKDILGHASLNTTLKYTHLQPSDLKHQHQEYTPLNTLGL